MLDVIFWWVGCIVSVMAAISVSYYILVYLWRWFSTGLTFWYMTMKMDWMYGIGVDADYRIKRFYRLRLLFTCLNPKAAFERDGCIMYNNYFHFDSEGLIPKFYLKHDALKVEMMKRQKEKEDG